MTFLPSKILNDRIDQLEVKMVEDFAVVDCPLSHTFTKGLYIRQVFIPANTLATSEIHKTQHPFTISKGRVLISEGNGEWVEVWAPYTGITQPGTRRVVCALEDTIWTTYHACRSITGKEDELGADDKELIINKIKSKIIQKHSNKALNEIKKNKICLS